MEQGDAKISLHGGDLPLPDQNITIIGSFNPTILSPEWVMKHVLGLRAGETRNVEMFGATTGGPNVYRIGEVYWVAERGRLRVFGPLEEAGPFGANILQSLPHTPVSAAGINLREFIDADLSKIGPFAVEVDRDGTRDLLGGVPQEVSFAHRRMRDDGVNLMLRITVAESDTRAMLDLNYHLSATSAEQLAQHINRSGEFAVDARRIIESLR